MKKGVVLVMTVLLAVGLFGCSALATQGTSPSNEGSSSTTQTASGTPHDLVITDSNYTISSSGYVHYVVEITNPNDGFLSEYATIEVVGKHPDGTIAFSDDWVISGLTPGSTTYWANQAGGGDAIPEDTIEISLSVNDRNWTASKQTVPANLYTFDNLSAKPQSFGSGITVTGEITLTEDLTLESGHSLTGPMLVCVLRDSAGKITAGFEGFMFKDLTTGKPTAFEISSTFDVGDYATAEMHANPWGY